MSSDEKRFPSDTLRLDQAEIARALAQHVADELEEDIPPSVPTSPATPNALHCPSIPPPKEIAMNTPTWVPGLDILTGEAADDRLCRFLRTLNGVSLSARVDVLKALIGRGVDPATLLAWMWQTNCATSALGVIAAACGSLAAAAAFHALLATASKIGTSPTWIYQIGRDLGVCVEYTGGPIPKGTLVSYANGDHFEWILSDMAADGIADHGGGGRANNAITVGRGDCRTSWGRKITHLFFFFSKLPASPDAAVGELDVVAQGPETAPAAVDEGVSGAV